MTVMTVWEIYEFLVTNEGVRYFTSDPRRLLPVVFLGVAGGIVAFGVSRLSPRSQRILNLIALSIFGLFMLVVLGVFALKGWLWSAGSI